MKKVFNSILFTSLLVTLLGCTKEKEVKAPDSVADNLFLINTFDGTQGTLEVSSQMAPQSAFQSYKAYGEQTRMMASRLNVPGVPQAMIEGLALPSPAGDIIDVQFEIDQRGIYLWKKVNSLEGLTFLEKSIAEKVSKTQYRVRVFNYNISSYGVMVQDTDSYNEKTTTLRLKPTSWEEATHIQLNFVRNERTELEAENNVQRENIFLKDKIDGKVMAADEVKKLFGLNFHVPDSSINILSKVDGANSLMFYEITTIGALTTDEKEALRNGLGAGKILECPKEVLQQLSDPEKKDCILLAVYRAQLKHKNAKLVQENLDGRASSQVRFEDTSTTDQTNLVEVVSGQTPEEILRGRIFDPSTTFKLSDLKGEFLFRRTMNDVANGFKHSFPGAQGRLEIVKFEAFEDQVIVKKADPLVRPDGSTSTDTEVLMSIPARFYKLQTHDESGAPLSIHRFVNSTHEDPQAWVKLDWVNNRTPDVLSPIAYHGVGQCFANSGNRMVTDLEQKLNKGILNFSLEGSYSVALSACASQYLTSDYYFKGNEQRTFNFKERISFRKYDGHNDNNRVLELPFYAQRQLNFGVFTSSKLVPNENGNIGRDGSEVHLPVLFDFSGGKSVTYTLAGLPKQGELREGIIKATELVVANWNQSLREAFRGSLLETSRDLILLEVEGRDVENVHLGDLNRNFIYWLEKNSVAGPLGIGGPSPNPRSGVIEASDIIIYGGNLIGYLEYVKKTALAKEFYKNTLQVLPASSDGATELEASEATTSSPVSSNQLEAQKIAREVSTDFFKPFQLHNDIKIDRDSLNVDSRNLPSLQRSLQSIVQTWRESDAASIESLDRVSLNKRALALQKIATEAFQNQALNNPSMMAGLVNKHMAEALKGKVAADDYNNLVGQWQEQAFVAQVAQSIAGGHQVVDIMDSGSSLGNSRVLTLAMNDLIVEKYAAVLVHEMGHALGLTHNFWGSYDKPNLLFSYEDPEKTRERSSSSVMDYLPMDVWEENAPGPYDVHAIRAAYTGRLEVEDAVKDLAQKDSNGRWMLDLGSTKLELSQGQYLHIEDYQKVLGMNSWLDFDANAANIIPLKKYRYCPDDQVYRIPTCNRFDYGSTAEAIVENMIESYQANYLINNFPDGRLSFNWWNSGSYVGQLFSTFQGIRHFMDETVFRLFLGDFEEETISHARAAFTGMQFFHQVIRTPEATSSRALERFELVELADGRKVVVEKRWSQDILQDGGQGRLRIRGVEYDKAVALLMISTRRLGIPDYDHRGVRMSFPDFERIFLGRQVTSQVELPSVKLLSEIMNNKVDPMAMTALGPLNLSGSANYNVELTELVRSIGVQAAILNLDVNTLEESNNFASLFRFGNSLSNSDLPTGASTLTQLGTQENSPTTLKYWAFSGADVSEQITSSAMGLKYLYNGEAEYTKDLARYFVLTQELGSSTTPEIVQEHRDLEQKIKAYLTKAPESIGIHNLDQLVQYMAGQIDLAQKVKEVTASLPEETAHEVIKSVLSQNDQLVRNLPALSLAQSALLSLEKGELSELIAQIISPSQLNIRYGLVFSNVELLNRLFYAIRPEYTH